jgi:hypothetical protein
MSRIVIGILICHRHKPIYLMYKLVFMKPTLLNILPGYVCVGLKEYNN